MGLCLRTAACRSRSCHWSQIQLPPSPVGNRSSLAQEPWLGAGEDGMPEGRVLDSPGHREVEFEITRQEHLFFRGDKAVK